MYQYSTVYSTKTIALLYTSMHIFHKNEDTVNHKLI